MPTYVYGLAAGASVAGCKKCRAAFEVVQRMSDPPLTACPECGAPVERRIQAPMVGSEERQKGPSEKRMRAGGFTQYKRKGKGYYEKSFGKGPDALHGR
jgi:putative FmdB family regulatory protein